MCSGRMHLSSLEVRSVKLLISTFYLRIQTNPSTYQVLISMYVFDNNGCLIDYIVAFSMCAQHACISGAYQLFILCSYKMENVLKPWKVHSRLTSSHLNFLQTNTLYISQNHNCMQIRKAQSILYVQRAFKPPHV